MAKRERIELAACGMSDEEQDALRGYAAHVSWPASFQIYERGAPAEGVFLVASGAVVLRSHIRGGRGFVPWISTPGETFGAEGLSANGRYATDARADVETETLFLSSAKLRAFVREQPAHALALVGQLMAERTLLLERLREVTTLSVEQRIGAALQRMAAYDMFVRDDGRIELHNASHRLFCEHVGATRESVSLVLGRLTDEGLAERVGNTLFVDPSPRLFERLCGGGEFAGLAAGTAASSSSAALG